MAAAKLKPIFRYLFSVFFVILGCFIFSRDDGKERPTRKKRNRRAISSFSSGFSSSWSYIKRVFLSSTTVSESCRGQTSHPNAPAVTTLMSARLSQNSLVTLIQPERNQPEMDSQKQNGSSCPEADISSDPQFFPLQNDIFPCTACGEIFLKSQLLEQHQTIKHAVSELIDGDSSTNIVKIIFKTGWPEKVRKNPEIIRILKIHSSPKILSRFEEYRELVKAKAARKSGRGTRRLWEERCAADGNELLRFYCSTFTCDLGQNGNFSLCCQQYCSVCGIIKSGFSPKLEGISTMSTSCRAHAAVPEDVEEEFGFMNVRRAILVCRVIAGRVGCDLATDDVDKDDGGYESAVGRGSAGGTHIRIDDEELLVFNPRAVLPCFVIVYRV